MEILFALAMFSVIALIATNQITRGGHFEYTFYSVILYVPEDEYADECMYYRESEQNNNVRCSKKDGVYDIRIDGYWYRVEKNLSLQVHTKLSMSKPELFALPKCRKIIAVG